VSLRSHYLRCILEGRKLTRISIDEKRRILGLFYQGNSRARIADIVSHSSATVQRVIKTHERDVRENGLIYELSEERLTEPLELARLYGELQAAGVSIAECRDALPIVRRCAELGVEVGPANELIDAAVRLGDPEFPREVFVQSLLRILRREQETGRSIEQMETTHNQLSSEVVNLRTEETTLRNDIRQLDGQKRQLDDRLRTSEERLKDFENRLAKIPVTETTLEAYRVDKKILASLGLDIDDLPKAKVALLQIIAMNYNAADIISKLARIQDLNSTVNALTNEVSNLQASVDTLTQQKDSLATEIQELENKREQVKKGLQKEEDEAHKTIMDLKCAVIEQRAKAKVKEQELADFVAARQALGKGGVPL